MPLKIAKYKAAVNPNLRWALFFVIVITNQVFAEKPAFLMAEYKAGNLRVIEQSGGNRLSPVGSTLKPFAAWYLLEQGVDPQQTVFCPPERKRSEKLRCWTPAGHGSMALQSALVQSCNYYFLSQFLGRNLKDYEAWLKSHFDWPDELAMTKAANVFGFDLDNGINPHKLLAMYAKLISAAESGNRHAQLITAGLGDVCGGTLSDFCRRAKRQPNFRLLFGKTGTVRDGKKNSGVALLYLEHLSQKRKILLLCYEKNKTGSEVALNALKILDAYARKR